MKDLKVALISHDFPPFMFGGVGSNCYDLAHSLSKKGITTTVFCGRSDSMRVEKLNDHLKVIRLPYLDFPPREFWFQLRNCGVLSRLLKDYTILHGVSAQSSVFCAYLKRQLRRPFVVSIHEVAKSSMRVFLSSSLSEWTIGDIGLLLKYPLFDFSIRKCLENSDHVVVCGSSALDDMKRYYGDLDLEKFSVIYNAINFDKIGKINDDPLEEDPSILFSGRLIWVKGILHLVRAIATVEKDFPNLNLEIFGEGPVKGKLESLISRLGLRDRIHLRGWISNAELIEHIKRATVVVLPSFYEVGPSISALEAMACRKPLVVFDFPFRREFISDMHNGVLAKAGDVKDLSEKISFLLSNGKLRRKIGQNAHDYVKRTHNWDRLVERYIEIYEKCMLHQT